MGHRSHIRQGDGLRSFAWDDLVAIPISTIMRRCIAWRRGRKKNIPFQASTDAPRASQDSRREWYAVISVS